MDIEPIPGPTKLSDQVGFHRWHFLPGFCSEFFLQNKHPTEPLARRLTVLSNNILVVVFRASRAVKPTYSLNRIDHKLIIHYLSRNTPNAEANPPQADCPSREDLSLTQHNPLDN